MERLTPDAVRALADRAGANPTCAHCASCASPGWESLRDGADALECVGALWLPGDEEPTLDERRPSGVDAWSAQAPIALAHHPYNRCQVWACRHCGKPFLRYTEYGGYYEDSRIRELLPDLITK